VIVSAGWLTTIRLPGKSWKEILKNEDEHADDLKNLLAKIS
jgi:hypothetical protein